LNAANDGPSLSGWVIKQPRAIPGEQAPLGNDPLA
jgi:hypothetical protein